MKPPLSMLLVVSLAVPAAGAPVSPAAANAVAPTTIDSEASLEYYIGLASKLTQRDSAGQLQVLKNQLDALIAEKKALQVELLAVEQKLSGAEAGGDNAKAQALLSAIQALKVPLAKIDNAIQNIVNEIQKLRDDEDRGQDEAKRGVDRLHKFATALTENPPRDPYVKTLSSSARAAVLARAQKGGDMLANVARVAGLTAANANSALTSAADKQRQLAEDQQRLRAAQATLGAVRTPTPTPRPVSKAISTGAVK